MGKTGASSFAYPPWYFWQAGQASAATDRITLSTRELFWIRFNATLVVEYSRKSAWQLLQCLAESGDWALHNEQFCTTYTSS
jgi:hypothetical protein